MNSEIDSLNEWLKDTYGLFDNAEPNYRVVWSDSQYEYRKGMFVKTDAHGNYLGEKEEVRFMPKYKQWIHHKWLLERLVPVPELGHDELATSKCSYEPLWVFEDKDGKPLPPKRQACWLIIKTVQEQMHKIGKGPAYKDPDSDPQEAIENKKQRIKQLEYELFGDETKTATALAHGTGIVVPHPQGEK